VLSIITTIIILIFVISCIILIPFYVSDVKSFMRTVFPRKIMYVLQEEKRYEYNTKEYKSTGRFYLVEKILWYEGTINITSDYITLQDLIKEKDELEKELIRKRDKKSKYEFRDIPEEEITLERLGDK